ncbi:MAG: TonB-dependent receptor [Acidobacteriota bacterium]
MSARIRSLLYRGVLKLFPLLILVAGTAAPVRGNQGAVPAGAPSLGGTVYDHNGNPLPDVIVFAQELASGLKIPAKSDAKGVYRIAAMPPGSYDVTATKAGYGPVGIHTVLLVSQMGHLDFTLTPGSEQDLDVEAAGKGANRQISDVPRSAHAVPMQQQGLASPKSVIEELQDRSIVGSQDANSSLQAPIVRGLDASRVVVLVDGQRLNSVATTLPTTILAPSQIESVEVLPGAGSTLNGSGAIAGTINIVTEKPRAVNHGHMLDLEVDGAVYSNGLKRSGAATLFYSNRWMGARLGGFLTRQQNYTAGNEEIPMVEVLRLGRFFTLVGNDPAYYPIWSLPKNAEIPNGASHGSGDSLTLYFYPAPKHNFQYSQLNVYTRDVGDPFFGPPLTNSDAFTEFIKIDKYSVRYEATKLTKWLSRISTGFYGQKFTVSNGQINYAIVPGSSFRPNQPGGVDSFTGNPSQFKLGNYTQNKLSVTSYSPDVQLTLTPLKAMIVTVGASYLNEDTDDEYANRVYDATIRVPPSLFPVPDFLYKNTSGFVQVEYNRISWLRLSGGVRVDNWKSQAQVTSGTTVANVSSTETSRNISAVFRSKMGLNTFIRWEKGFREPSIGERVKSPIVGGGGNNPFEPEAAQDVEVGVKLNRKLKRMQINGSLAFFHNDINNFYRGDAAFRAPAGVAAAALKSVTAPSQTGSSPLNQIVLQGLEGSYQINIPLGRHGSISPFGNMNWLYGRDETPIEPQLSLISALYNRTDLPVRLKGAIDDVPQGLIAPFQGSFGARYTDARGRFTAQYNLRHSSRVTRVEPFVLLNLPFERGGPTLFYSTYRNLDPFTVQSVKATFTKSSEKYRLTFSIGVENLTNRLFWEHFTPSPAVGRSFTFGMATNFADLLSRF